jgi:hypothetical protein
MLATWMLLLLKPFCQHFFFSCIAILNKKRKKSFIFFYKIREQQGRTCPPGWWGVDTWGRRR